jgi:hypothetical protein
MRVRYKALLSFSSVALALLIVVVGSSGPEKRPSHPVVARVIRVYVAGAHFPRTVIIAHVPHAIDAHATFPASYAEDCGIGDEVNGKQTGLSLTVDPYTCRRPSNGVTGQR